MEERTRRFLDAARKRGWLTSEQAESARQVARTLREVGESRSLDEILVRKGYLSREQTRAIRGKVDRGRIGRYRLLARIGSGTSGTVYRAVQEPLEREVAVKVLARELSRSEEKRERFRREARIAVTLNHGNLVRGLDHGEDEDGRPYFVMEYVEGRSLSALLDQEGALDEARALDLTIQTAKALEHATEFHLVHRDVKPRNILVTPEGTAKLCDLGLAKPSPLAETAGKTLVGTPYYLAPERIRDRGKADFRADIYSLGATLFHMVTGRPPFTGDTIAAIFRGHLREPVPDPRTLFPSLTSATRAVLSMMLAKDPADRYGSYGSLMEDLRSALDGRPPIHAIRLERRRPRRRRRFSPTLLVMASAVLAAAAGLASILLDRSDRSSPPETAPEEPSRAEAPRPPENVGPRTPPGTPPPAPPPAPGPEKPSLADLLARALAPPAPSRGDEAERLRVRARKRPEILLFLGERDLAEGRVLEVARARETYLSAVRRHAERVQEEQARALAERAESLEEEARDAYRRKRWEIAADLYEELLRIAPDRTEALYYLGASRLRLSDPVSAYRTFRRYLAAEEPGSHAATARREARRLLRAHRDVESAEELCAAGRKAFEAGDLLEAFQRFSEAITEAPLRAEAYLWRARAVLALDPRDVTRVLLHRTLDDCRLGRDLDPELRILPEGETRCLYRLARYEEAAETAKAAIREDPDRWQGYDAAGQAHHALGNPKLAVALYDEGLQRAPTEPWLFIHRALAYVGLGRPAAAEKDLQSALASRPSRIQIREIDTIMELLMQRERGR